MRFTDNSRGRQQSLPRRQSARQKLSHEDVIPPISRRSPKFLIANLELEFNLIPIRISNLRFSNRKFLAISRRPFLLSNGPVAKPRRGTLPTHHSLPDATFLIETPRLESLATPTKQSPSAKSNRDKIGLLSSAPRGATSRATLTLRASQSNLPASCFVRVLAGEHS